MKNVVVILVAMFVMFTNAAQAQKFEMMGFTGPTANIMGYHTISVGDTVSIRVDLTGDAKKGWDLVITDGTSTFNVLGITETPYYLTVIPTIPSKVTTYSIVSVSNGECASAGTGFATIVVKNH